MYGTYKGFVINYREGRGAINGKKRGSETVCAPPPPLKTRYKFSHPPFEGENI